MSNRSTFRFFTVDAFTDEPFKGNQAGVCLVPINNEPNDEIKQKLATEMNISETAFIIPANSNENFETGSRFKLRWFTPTVEVPLCGHATLASAAVLFQGLKNNSPKLSFETMSGILICKREKDGKITMEFPLRKPVPAANMELDELAKIATGGFPYTDIQFSEVATKLLIRLDDSVTRSDLESINPRFDLLFAANKYKNIRGVIVTIKGNGKPYDFLSRYFAPWNGINEDPVTGSAHTVLAPYWANVLGKKSFLACQSSKRSGDLWLKIGENEDIEISGFATLIIEGVATF